MTSDELTVDLEKAWADINDFKLQRAMGRVLKAITSAAAERMMLTEQHHDIIARVTDMAARCWPQEMFDHKDATTMLSAIFNHHYGKWVAHSGARRQRLGQYLLNQLPTVNDSEIWYSDDPVKAGNLFVDRYVIGATVHVPAEGKPFTAFSVMGIKGHWIVRQDKGALTRPYRLFHDRESACLWAQEQAKIGKCVARFQNERGEYEEVISFMDTPSDV